MNPMHSTMTASGVALALAHLLAFGLMYWKVDISPVVADVALVITWFGALALHRSNAPLTMTDQSQ